MEGRNRSRKNGSTPCGCSCGWFKTRLTQDQDIVVHTQPLRHVRGTHQTKNVKEKAVVSAILIQNNDGNEVSVQTKALLPEFDLNAINCPLCKHYVQRARAMLKDAFVVKNNNISCVCEMCDLKRLTRLPCLHCENIRRKLKLKDYYLSRKKDLLKQQEQMFLKTVLGRRKKERQTRDFKAYSEIHLTDTLERINKHSQRVQRPKSTDSRYETKFKVEFEQAIGHDRWPSYRSRAKADSMKYESLLGLGTTGLMRRCHSEESLRAFSVKEENTFKYIFPCMMKDEKLLFETSADQLKDIRKRFQADVEEKIREQEKIKTKKEINNMIEWAKQRGINLSDIDITVKEQGEKEAKGMTEWAKKRGLTSSDIDMITKKIQKEKDFNSVIEWAKQRGTTLSDIDFITKTVRKHKNDAKLEKIVDFETYKKEYDKRKGKTVEKTEQGEYLLDGKSRLTKEDKYDDKIEGRQKKKAKDEKKGMDEKGRLIKKYKDFTSLGQDQISLLKRGKHGEGKKYIDEDKFVVKGDKHSNGKKDKKHDNTRKGNEYEKNLKRLRVKQEGLDIVLKMHDKKKTETKGGKDDENEGKYKDEGGKRKEKYVKQKREKSKNDTKTEGGEERKEKTRRVKQEGQDIVLKMHYKKKTETKAGKDDAKEGKYKDEGGKSKEIYDKQKREKSKNDTETEGGDKRKEKSQESEDKRGKGNEKLSKKAEHKVNNNKENKVEKETEKKEIKKIPTDKAGKTQKEVFSNDVTTVTNKYKKVTKGKQNETQDFTGKGTEKNTELTTDEKGTEMYHEDEDILSKVSANVTHSKTTGVGKKANTEAPSENKMFQGVEDEVKLYSHTTNGKKTGSDKKPKAPPKQKKNQGVEDEVKLLNEVLTKQDKYITVGKNAKKTKEEKIKSLKRKAVKTVAEHTETNKPLETYDPSANKVEKIDTSEKDRNKPVGDKETVPLEKIKIMPSDDDLILKMIINANKNKITQKEHKQMKPIMPLPIPIRRKRKSSSKNSNTVEPDTDQESLFSEPSHISKPAREMVFGTKVKLAKDVPPEPEPTSLPVLFHTEHNAATFEHTIRSLTPKEDIKQSAGEGPLRYALSDRKFIENGWTVLPTEKIVRKVNVYRMRPVHPEFDWFSQNKNKGTFRYSSGEKLAEIDENGRGRWYYKNGRLALNYYDCEEPNAEQRYVVYSSGEPDERGRSTPITVLGMFDFNGNGVVFDHGGKIRLKYNQNEGIVLDRSIGPVTHWKWHSLNDPPELKLVMEDSYLDYKDPVIYSYDADHQPPPQDATLLAIEYQNYVKSKEIKKDFKPYQINMKTMKLNNQFTLKVLDQNRIYLLFRDGVTAMKCNLGLKIDNSEILDTTFCELGEVCATAEKLPAATDSLADLQKCLKETQKWNQVRVARELKKTPLPPTLSADRMTAATSKPLRRPLLTENSGKRTPASGNLYYNTRLI